MDFGSFDSTTTSYTAQVANSVSETTVTPTANDSGASYVIKLGGVEDVDGVVSLAVGSSVMTVEVTAEDDSTTRDLHCDNHPRGTALNGFHPQRSDPERRGLRHVCIGDAFIHRAGGQRCDSRRR